MHDCIGNSRKREKERGGGRSYCFSVNFKIDDVIERALVPLQALRQELQSVQYYVIFLFIICNYKYVSRTMKPSKLSAIPIEDFPLVKGREESKVRLNRKEDDGQKSGWSSLFAPSDVSLLREGIRFVFADATRRLESREKENRERRKEKRRKKGEGGVAKRNAEGMPFAFSQSRRNFARLDGNWRTEK